MEQFYQDNRSYRTGTGTTCGAAVPAGLANFAVACATANAGQTYVATATGAGSTNGFVFTIDQANARRTTGLPSDWGTVPTGGMDGWKTR
jgi:type IV pilus assembly protein PilE